MEDNEKRVIYFSYSSKNSSIEKEIELFFYHLSLKKLFFRKGKYWEKIRKITANAHIIFLKLFPTIVNCNEDEVKTYFESLQKIDH